MPVGATHRNSSDGVRSFVIVTCAVTYRCACRGSHGTRRVVAFVAMKAEAVQSLAQTAVRLRARSATLRSSCTTTVARSRQLRSYHQVLVTWRQQLTRHQDEDTLCRVFYRKLVTGCLPYDSAPSLSGAPGLGGICGACDQPLVAAQLVMSVPTNGGFVQLHGNCFTLWDRLRRRPTPSKAR